MHFFLRFVTVCSTKVLEASRKRPSSRDRLSLAASSASMVLGIAARLPANLASGLRNRCASPAPLLVLCRVAGAPAWYSTILFLSWRCLVLSNLVHSHASDAIWYIRLHCTRFLASPFFTACWPLDPASSRRVLCLTVGAVPTAGWSYSLMLIATDTESTLDPYVKGKVALWHVTYYLMCSEGLVSRPSFTHWHFTSFFAISSSSAPWSQSLGSTPSATSPPLANHMQVVSDEAHRHGARSHKAIAVACEQCAGRCTCDGACGLGVTGPARSRCRGSFT